MEKGALETGEESLGEAVFKSEDELEEGHGVILDKWHRRFSCRGGPRDDGGYLKG